jgi:hypothetical protein
MQFDHAKFKSLVHYVIGRAGDREGFEATKLYKVLWFSEARAFVLSHQPICGETYIRAELGPFPKHAPEILLELEREGTIRVLGDRNVDSPALLFKALQNPDASTLTDDHRKIVEYAIGRVDADHTAISPGEASHDAAWEIAKLGEEIPYFALLAIRMREPRGRELEWVESRCDAVAVG